MFLKKETVINKNEECTVNIWNVFQKEGNGHWKNLIGYQKKRRMIIKIT